MEILAAILILIIVVAGLLVYSVFSYGYLLFKFYYWFLLPIFPSIPEVTFMECCGLMFIVGLFKNHSSSSYQVNGKKIEYKNWWTEFLSPWMYLFIGYLFKIWFL